MKPATRRVGEFLRLRGPDGCTEAEIQAATTYRSGGQRVHELRREHHWDIESVPERTPLGAVIVRYVWHSDPESRPRPMTGVQIGAFA